MPPSPREEYSRRLELAREVGAAQDRLDARIANGRLLVFLLAVAVGWAALGAARISAWWLAAPAIAFVALVALHGRAARARERAGQLVAIYERGLARIDDRWIGVGRDGARFLDPTHPYAADLDLFGPGSLFQRISTARTRAGEAVLASWLLAPADPEIIRSRQESVADLRGRLDLREDLARLGSLGDAIEAEALVSWSEGSEPIPLGWVRLVPVALGLAVTIGGLAWFFLGLDARIVLGIVAVEAAFAGWLARRSGRILEGVSKRADDLDMIASILERIERETFTAPGLLSSRGRLFHSGVPASTRIAALHRRVELLEMQRNPLAPFWLLGTQVAMAVESWRRRSGHDVAGWVAVVAEIESLASLAAYSFENPDDPFAEVVPDGPSIEARALGHPLLPKAALVRNDVSLGGELRVLIVSGSNMSGKSTLLRSVGANIVLALAGAPVRAEGLWLSPVGIGATLRIQDSLQEGKSRFYAEILRLRQVVDLTGAPLPLLFLLDEILHGTNSHDRLEGASAVVRGLIDRGAIGLVTTHDLALAEVAEKLQPRARNVHFEDHFEDGVMRFDYTMRPGVVRKSNALALMRAVGLDV